MFIGHAAVAFAAKRAAPRTSLGTLTAAAMLLDLIWPIFVLAGIEVLRIDPGNTRFTPLDFVSYPWTHSLAAAVAWSVAGGTAFYLWRRDRSAALIVGLCVFSHWFLDFLTHRPDLALAPGSSVYFGLGLWNHVVATVVIEVGMLAAAVLLYATFSSAKDKAGVYGLWAYVGFLLLIYAANLAGPPPPSAMAVGAAGLSLWLLVPWTAWIDRHRTAGRGRHRWP